jgi:glycosyltransferase involved in cell wall biosynthesis
MRKAKISAGIITKNEEKNIKGCIESVRGWANEIIVVDGYSTDKTASIAEGLGARVVKHNFEGDFSKERNMVMENASGEWVLHLDADEKVTLGFKKKVDEVIDSAGDIDIYKFKRKNFFLGHFMERGGWYHYIPNLVRRDKVKFEGALHERPVSGGKIGVIEADIEHYPFGSISQFLARHNRYSSVDAEKMFKRDGASLLGEVKKNAIRRTFKLFWKMYVKKKGYKEGIYGLVFAILFAFTNFLIWVKYWELCMKEKNK